MAVGIHQIAELAATPAGRPPARAKWALDSGLTFDFALVITDAATLVADLNDIGRLWHRIGAAGFRKIVRDRRHRLFHRAEYLLAEWCPVLFLQRPSLTPLLREI